MAWLEQLVRTVDSTLQAALAGGRPLTIFRGYIGYSNGTVKHSGVVYSYRLTGTSLEFVMPYHGDIASDQEMIWLERGLAVAGTEYTLTTGRFFIVRQDYHADGTQTAYGTLFPNQYYSADGHDTYENVITAFVESYGKTVTFKDDTEAWLDYEFLAGGENIVLRDAMDMLPLLKQKRLIVLCDNGDEDVLVYCADTLGTSLSTIPIADEWRARNTKLRRRQYVSIDEAGAYHQSGTATDPIHNLGYLESTDSAPSRKTATWELEALIRPDLRWQDGDVLTASMFDGANTFKFFAQVVEEFERGGRKPNWRLRLQANPVFGNTEGGDVPKALESLIRYGSLDTSGFDGILSENESNIVQAVKVLDGHGVADHTDYGAAAREVLTADRDYYVDSSSGSDTSDGLTSGAAFATIQHAFDIIGALDLSIYDVTVNLASGTYSEGTIDCPNCVGAGIVYVVGDTGTPSNVSAAMRFTKYTPGTIYHFQGIKFTGSLTSILTAWNAALLRFDHIECAGSYTVHLDLDQNGIIEQQGAYTISAGTAAHIWCHSGSLFRCAAVSTVTISGTPAWSAAFAYVTRAAVAIIPASNITFSGSATGKRYDAQMNGVIQTNGGGASYLPGNAAGTTATGGQYA